MQGVWDSVKGVSLIFIVAKHTYSDPKTDDGDRTRPKTRQSDQTSNSDAIVDDESSSSSSTNPTNSRRLRKNPATKRDKLEE